MIRTIANLLGLFAFCVLTSATADETRTPDSPSDVAEPTYLLRYQFQPGQKLRYQTLQVATMDAAREDQRKSDRSEVEQRRLFTIEKIDDSGVAHIAMQFEFVRMQLQANGGQPVVFRSDMKAEEIPKMFQMTADRLRGSAARYQVLSTGLPNPAPEVIVRTGGSSADKNDAGSFLMPLAEQPVAVGDTWTDSQFVSVRVTEKIDRKIEILRSFRLESVTDDIATIKFFTSIVSPVHTPAIRAQLIQSTPKGTLMFDIKRGMMLEKQLKFDQTVINGAGENTVVSSYGSYTETLLEDQNSGQPEAAAAEAAPSEAAPAGDESASKAAAKDSSPTTN